MSVKIHPTAIIDSSAQIGEDVEIGPYSVLGPDVKIGDRTKLLSHVVVDGRTTLGPENTLYPFSSVGTDPQDLKFAGEESRLIIGARNKIREYVTIQPGTATGRMETEVGDNNLFMACSHVGHDCLVGSNNVFANSVALAGHVTIQDGAILGGLVGIHQYTRIGAQALISAGSMVGGDVPPFCFAQGDRAHLRGINAVGLKRANFSREEVQAIKKLYRYLFSSVGKLEDKLRTIPADIAEANDKTLTMLEFLKGSDRGILTPFKNLGAE